MWLYIVFALFVFIVIALVIYNKSKPQSHLKESAFSTGEVNLKIKGAFLDAKETYYFDFMQRHLDDDKLIIPKVGVDNLLAPIGAKRQYESICSKYVDFVIFEKKTMLPIVAIDFVEDKMSSKLTYFDKDIQDALCMVNIPIYTQYVEDFYVYEDIQKSMEASIPALDTKTNKVENVKDEEPKAEEEQNRNKEKVC